MVHSSSSTHKDNNDYKIDLPGNYNVSATFNISDLSLFDIEWIEERIFPKEGRVISLGTRKRSWSYLRDRGQSSGQETCQRTKCLSGEYYKESRKEQGRRIEDF